MIFLSYEVDLLKILAEGNCLKGVMSEDMIPDLVKTVPKPLQLAS